MVRCWLPIARIGGRLLVVLPWVFLPGEAAANGLPYAVVNALNPTPWDLPTQSEIDEALQNLSDQIAAASADLEHASAVGWALDSVALVVAVLRLAFLRGHLNTHSLGNRRGQAASAGGRRLAETGRSAISTISLIFAAQFRAFGRGHDAAIERAGFVEEAASAGGRFIAWRVTGESLRPNAANVEAAFLLRGDIAKIWRKYDTDKAAAAERRTHADRVAVRAIAVIVTADAFALCGGVLHAMRGAGHVHRNAAGAGDWRCARDAAIETDRP